ncbi:pyridoxamine 5'-phosphate oxidase family protein [Planctomycetota bacterium]
MDLKTYFETTAGTGILATANSEGAVDIAVYASPHVIDNQTVAFIMRDRLSHHNVQSNPQAAYLFLEAGEGHQGKRLYLTCTGEETDPERIASLRRRSSPDKHPDEKKFLVSFRVDKVLPAVATEPH